MACWLNVRHWYFLRSCNENIFILNSFSDPIGKFHFFLPKLSTSNHLFIIIFIPIKVFQDTYKKEKHRSEKMVGTKKTVGTEKKLLAFKWQILSCQHKHNIRKKFDSLKYFLNYKFVRFLKKMWIFIRR